MPRAAFSSHENVPFATDSETAAAEVCTARRTAAASASADERAAAGNSPVRHGWADARAVAAAFLTNLSGGAACFDVDLSLIAHDTLTESLADEFNDVRKLMLLANSASWELEHAEQSTAVVVATATMIGKDSFTDTMRFTLHIDLAAAATTARPITHVVIHERSHTNTETWSRAFQGAVKTGARDEALVADVRARMRLLDEADSSEA